MTLNPDGSPLLSPDDVKFLEEYEETYPEMTSEFKRIAMLQYVTFCRKNNDYGTSNIALGSDLRTDDDKRVSLTGLWYRMMDKINRLKTLIVLNKTNAVKDENVSDSFSDLSVYGIIAQIILNGKWAK